jgi:hypothetical protein
MATRTNNHTGGETRLGTLFKNLQSILYIRSAKPAQGAVIALDSVQANGTRTTHYLWFSSDGKLRTGSTIPANTETGGSVVGAQT